MAVIMTKEKTQLLLTTLFGADSQPVQKVLLLQDAGAQVVFKLFGFQVSITEDKIYTCSLPCLSADLQNPQKLPGTTLAVVTEKVKAVIEAAFHELPAMKSGKFSGEGQTITPPTEHKAEPVPAPKATKAKASATKPSHLQAEPPAKEKLAASLGVKGDISKLVSTPIKLAQAEVVGQKVKGTSESSVYRTAAVSQDVRVAAKFGTNALSIRAESPEWTVAMKSKLSKAGFSDHGSYMSLHLTGMNDIPPMRVLGAVLFSIDHSFDRVATSVKEIT